MEPITVTVNDASRSLGIGRTKLYELIEQGRLQTIKLGRRRLIKVDSIRRLTDASQIAA